VYKSGCYGFGGLVSFLLALFISFRLLSVVFLSWLILASRLECDAEELCSQLRVLRLGVFRFVLLNLFFSWGSLGGLFFGLFFSCGSFGLFLSTKRTTAIAYQKCLIH
jgi:hypothetical protein